jgi:phage gp29-like protein
MPSLYDRVVQAIANRIPTKRVTRYDVRQMPSEIAGIIDVDRAADIIRSAQEGNLEDLFALYRDIILTHSHLQGRLGDRKEAVIGDALSIQPMDKKQPADVLAAELVQDQVKNLQSWEAAMLHLLDSTLYPVAVVEKVFRPAARTITVTAPGVLPSQATPFVVPVRYELAELVPVPHELLDFRDGCLKIRKVNERGQPTGANEELDPTRYIVHRGHTLSTPDSWGGPMRSLVMWWFLSVNDREWWGRFLDKYGMPFLVGKYDTADDASRTILERAFSLATKLGGLVVSRETQVEIKQASASDGGDAFEKMHRIANEEISKLILGQTLSSDAKGNGLSDGGATDQGEVRQDKRRFDARRLGATLRYQLFEQILRYNGISGRAPIAVWGAVSIKEMTAYSTWLQNLRQGGLRVGDDGLEVLSELFGMSIERDPSPQAAGAPPGGLLPMSIQLHSASGQVMRAGAANQAILRTGGARLAQALGKTYAPLEALIATANSPAEALERIETYCATLDPVTAADVIEQSLAAFAANGSATIAS